MESDKWTDSTQESIIAYMIAQQVVPIAMSELIQSFNITVTSTNSTFEGRYAWMFGSPLRSGYDNRSAIMFFGNTPTEVGMRRIENFKRRMESILLDPITQNGMMGINLSIDCDVYGDFAMCLRLDGGQEYRWTRPNFSNAFTSSLITTDIAHCTAFSQDLSNLVTNVVDNASQA